MNTATDKILATLKQYQKELREISAQMTQTNILMTTSSAQSRISGFLKKLGTFLAENGLRREIHSFPNPNIHMTSIGYIEEIDHVYLPALQSLISRITESPEIISPEEKTDKTPSSPKEKFVPTGNKVFIVHGHDEANLYKLKDLLKDHYNLECVIMKFRAGKGRTLIEKFEQEAGDAGFAFILMTPDDLVEIPGKKEQYAQARPNVIFELGWFHGKLGRNRVCILFKKGTQIHSDLAGVSRIEFNESVEEKVLEIEQELRAAKLIK